MIFLFSNIKASPSKANALSASIKQNDTLVFLNTAQNYDYFKDSHTAKILICAVKGDADGKLVKAIEEGRIEGITVE